MTPEGSRQAGQEDPKGSFWKLAVARLLCRTAEDPKCTCRQAQHKPGPSPGTGGRTPASLKQGARAEKTVRPGTGR